jgi:hypothetical protein
MKRNRLKWVYLVHYKYQDDKGCVGDGTLTLSRKHRIDSQAELTSSCDYIKSENNLNKVMIVNFQLLNKRGIV